jgi:hypothetical protein
VPVASIGKSTREDAVIAGTGVFVQEHRGQPILPERAIDVVKLPGGEGQVEAGLREGKIGDGAGEMGHGRASHFRTVHGIQTASHAFPQPRSSGVQPGPAPTVWHRSW